MVLLSFRRSFATEESAATVQSSSLSRRTQVRCGRFLAKARNDKFNVALAILVLSMFFGFARPAHATQVERALFSAGCFWKVQYVFSKVPGVVKTRVGYCGGSMKDPSYEQVCTDKTGHAETVEIVYDPAKTSYEKLLKVFFDKHDPTTPNRQGPDIGTQYRSMIFYTTPEQKLTALKYVDELERKKRFYAPISTKIEAAGRFYPAEEYHQDYYKKHGNVCF